jgi:pyruvyltransferase
MSKEKINLLYFHEKQQHGNFGDELSKFIVEKLINKNKYELVFNQENIKKNLIAIGSYLHVAKDNYYIYGTGLRTNPPIEGALGYKNLFISACRGPKTYDFLKNEKKLNCPQIYGDPALLLKEFYIPKINEQFKNKIVIVPHKSHYGHYKKLKLNPNFIVINPRDHWKDVVNNIFSAKAVISSSLHGIIIADVYKRPNIMLCEFELTEGKFKFQDYYSSQKRPFLYINHLKEFDEKLLYHGGNKIDLKKLKDAFPFK